MEGNQTAPKPCGLTLDSFEPGVPRAVKLEGAGFFLHGRVGIAARDRDAVHFVVRSRRPYDVRVGVTTSGKVTVECDCVPFVAEPAVCRHIWAALIKTQNDGLLELPAVTTAVP
jgi:hypothetical protein